jgi:peptidoglycan/LPS O-acetylase OafA/YrhL
MNDSSSDKIKVYFENLNGIRFIAALLVIVHHIEQFKRKLGINGVFIKAIDMVGKLGVVLFFVLSGFLITYLLLKEQEVKKRIAVKSFYLRRILRIWPLYFAIVFIAFFIMPFSELFALPGLGKDFVWNDLGIKLALFAAFLPNLVLSIYGAIPYVSQAWSIGAEEQFYLIWPVLNNKFKNKWILMFCVILVYLFIRSLLYLLPSANYATILKGFWESAPIHCMAIGGMFSLLIYDKNPIVLKLKAIIFNKVLQWSVLLLTIGLIVKAVRFPFIQFEVFSVLFGILIVNFAANNKRIFSLEYSWLNYLGKISYGLYMYHPIAIVFTIVMLQRAAKANDLLIYPISLLVVIIIASLSYEFFEKRFIKLKGKYSQIISGDNAKD